MINYIYIPTQVEMPFYATFQLYKK